MPRQHGTKHYGMHSCVAAVPLLFMGMHVHKECILAALLSGLYISPVTHCPSSSRQQVWTSVTLASCGGACIHLRIDDTQSISVCRPVSLRNQSHQINCTL